MPKKQIATFLGTGNHLSIAGDHAYAYSGGVALTNDSVECLNFTTGKESIMAKFYFTMDDDTLGNGKVAGFQIKLNGIIIAHQNEEYSDSYEAQIPKSIKFFIPPLTNVITIASTDSTNANIFYHTLTGKLYK